MRRRDFMLFLPLLLATNRESLGAVVLGSRLGNAESLPTIAGYASVENIVNAYLENNKTRQGDLFKVELSVSRIADALIDAGRIENIDPISERRLAEEIDSDFKHGRVHVLDGWLQSRTELALCLSLAKA